MQSLLRSRGVEQGRIFTIQRSWRDPCNRRCNCCPHAFCTRKVRRGTLERSSFLGGASRQQLIRRQSRVYARAEDLPVKDRVFGALPYLVPLLDGIRYGRYFFFQFPVAAQVLAPIRPLLNLYYGVPFASLVIFFGLYGGVANNMSFSRHIRFNAMQALLLSIILIFPSLIEQVFRGSLSGGVLINLYNTIWLFVAASVSYGAGSSLLGTVARLPLVGNAADQRVP